MRQRGRREGTKIRLEIDSLGKKCMRERKREREKRGKVYENKMRRRKRRTDDNDEEGKREEG